MTDNLKLTEMLCARFSHDIIGPVGALNNGAEFLREELGNKESMAADLIESSSKEAVARVQYYRQAYGYLAAGNASSAGDVQELAGKYFAAGKIKLNRAEMESEISAAQKKILLNLLIAAAGSLIRGGVIKVSLTGGIITVEAAGDKAALHENYRKTLRGEMKAEEIDARLIQCHYTYQLARENNTEIILSESSEKVVFSCRA